MSIPARISGKHGASSERGILAEAGVRLAGVRLVKLAKSSSLSFDPKMRSGGALSGSFGPPRPS